MPRRNHYPQCIDKLYGAKRVAARVLRRRIIGASRSAGLRCKRVSNHRGACVTVDNVLESRAGGDGHTLFFAWTRIYDNDADLVGKLYVQVYKNKPKGVQFASEPIAPPKPRKKGLVSPKSAKSVKISDRSLGSAIFSSVTFSSNTVDF